MTGVPVRVGAKTRLAHTFDAGDATLEVTGVFASVYSSAQVAVVDGGLGAVSTNAPAPQVTVSYLFDTTGQDPDDYTYLLRTSLADGRVEDVTGEVILISPASRFDRWVNAVRGWMTGEIASRSSEFVGWKQLRDAALAAVEEYSGVRPRLRQATQPLTGNVWEYDLPADFEGGISYFELGNFEYPVDAATHAYPVLAYLRDFTYDLSRAKLIFLPGRAPSGGETARYAYRARHVLTDSEDTLPAEAFRSVAQYAAGLALDTAAAKAAGMGDAAVGAAVVDYKSKQEQFTSAAERLKLGGRRAWGVREPFVV